MPIDDRDYVRGSHPPTCTCADCTEKRLKSSSGFTRAEHTSSYRKPSFFRKLKKVKSFQLGRLWATILGITGGFILYVSLAPVILSGRNSEIISEWRDIILQWTQFTGYLRLIFSIGSLIIIGIGLLGVVITFLKPRGGQILMFWGGISALLLLTALWSGLLDLHVPIFGSTDISSRLIWDGNWGIANWGISKRIMQIFGGGWLKPAFTGAIMLVLTAFPHWWSKLR